MDPRGIEEVFGKYKVNVGRLMYWLQLPKQGINPQVAVKVIQEVHQEILDGKTRWKESTFFPEHYRKKMAEGVFPEHFWIDNYILEKCRIAQSEMLVGGNVNSVEDILKLQMLFAGIAKELEAIRKMIAPIRAFLTTPNYLKPKTWWRKTKGVFKRG